MFMLSASGTAAFGKTDKEDDIEEQNETISFDKLNYEVEREMLTQKVLADSYSIQYAKEIEELLEYKIDIVEKVVNYIDNNLPYLNEYKDLLNEYFLNVSKESINNFIKSDLFLSIPKETFKKFLEILEAVDWFDYDVIFSLLNNSNPIAQNRALYLLEFESDYYSKYDIPKLNHFVELLKNTFKKYPILQTKKGVFGKEKEGWECLNCGTINSKDNMICYKYECQSNIYGIPNDKINPVRIKKTLITKISKLKQLLKID